MGLMGYRTPNIDRIAKEGMIFTDYYGEQSCTAGRSSFITGQSVFRTGLSKVGLPGADLGLRAEDPTIAELLKPHGYATGQFGKNHLGDRDEFLPTAHGFDEFFGNLYHLNAEEEPENEDYPKDPAFRKRFGPRGVIRSYADGRIEDTGPLTRKRMETVDDETIAAALDFVERQHKAGKPFFVWWNGTRMHFRTHVKKENRGISGQDVYADGMVEHDGHVGQLLDKLDELGIADNTIVFYSTDNGPHYNTWPDAAATPFRGEKNTNWEGGWRVPAMVRWPGKIKAGSVSNEIMHHMDWLPTSGRRRRFGHQAEAAQRTPGREPDIQGSSRRIQLPAASDRKREKGPPERDLLLLRRRRPDGVAVRRLEGRVHGAARAGDVSGVDGSFRAPAGAEDLQLAPGSVRTGRPNLQYLLRLDAGPGLSAASGERLRGGVPEDVQGVPAAPESGQLYHRPGAGGAEAADGLSS